MSPACVRVAMVAGLSLVATASAEARPALCETPDDGRYPCSFTPVDRRGSFVLSAHAKPSYTMWITAPGEASAFVEKHRSVPLAGPFLNSSADPGCWVSDTTGFRVCADAAETAR